MARKVNNQLYRLPDDVTFHRLVSHAHFQELFVSVKPPETRICPKCGSHACVIKSSDRKQTVRHSHVSHSGVLITFKRKRYLCKDCNSSFMQPIPWIHPTLHMTMALFFDISLDLCKLLSIRAIAQIHCVTESVVLSVFDQISVSRPKHLPSTLNVDEFKADCGEWNPVTRKWDTVRFLTNVTDGDSHRVIDVIDATNQQNLSKYFHKYGSYERRKVQYFCCDMSGSYISLAKNTFPNAVICIDMFHVVNRLNDAVDNVRRRLQKKTRDAGEEQAYSDLKHLSRILKTRCDRQDDLWKDHAPLYRQRLETAFCSFPELREVYEMLQDFHSLAASDSLTEKQNRLNAWLLRYTVSLVKEVSDAANTIDRYNGYILNSWKHNLSNGPCEGINNRIKALKRVSFGFHHYKYFRKRILLTCGNTKPEIASYTIYNRGSNE